MDKHYFEDEVRSGFYVPGMVKRSWAAQLEVLAEVDRICRKYDIQYFAEWGTLLGAVRHKGFVPWDDDMDISMKRDDYVRFLQIAPGELREGFSLGNVYTDVGFTNLLSRIVNTRKIRLDDEFLQEFHQFPYVAGLDIFPLDYIAANEEDNAFQMQILDIVATFANNYESHVVEWGDGAPYIEQIQQLCSVQFDRGKPIQQQLLILLDRLSALYHYEDAEYITAMSLWKDDQQYKFPKNYYDEAVYLPFEYTTIPVPKAYDAILRHKYGDYMRLVKDGGSHDYPFFKVQEKSLWESTGIQYRQYVCPPEVNRGRRWNREEQEEKTVVFLPYQASKWNTLESVWEAACRDEHTKVIVAPLPYFHRGFKGEQLDFCYERELFLEYVETVDYQTLNLAALHPDIIITQDCCDEYNKCLSIHPDFYTSRIWEYTDRLVYIPWFLLDDFDQSEERSYANMENYCFMPGIVHADVVCVQSDQMRKMYVQKLVEWAGEETRQIWEQKIVVTGYSTDDQMDIPEHWKQMAAESHGKHKKIMVYGNSASLLVEHGQQAIDKLRRVLGLFEERKDEITLIWRPSSYLENFSEQAVPNVWKDYLMLEQEYMEAGWGIYLPEDSPELSGERLAFLADAYYGDAGELAHLFSQQHKPVMLQNVDI